MGKLTLEHQEEILTFPTDTILDLKVEECIIESIPTRNGGTWEKLRMKFKILGIQALGDGSQDFAAYDNWIAKEIWGSVPYRLTDSPENRLRIWAEAIFKTELGLGFELDTDMFLGRHVRGLTSQYEAKGRGSDGRPFMRHQIETLLPAADAQAPGQMPAQPAAPAQQWAQPQQQQTWAAAPAAPVNDPWASPAGSDEPPF
jgi:hypothetical protein